MAVLVLAYVAFLYCLGRENTCHRSFTFRKSNENPLRRYYQFFVEITILAENLFMFSSPLGFQDTRGERHTIAIFVLKKKNCQRSSTFWEGTEDSFCSNSVTFRENYHLDWEFYLFFLRHYASRTLESDAPPDILTLYSRDPYCFVLNFSTNFFAPHPATISVAVEHSIDFAQITCLLPLRNWFLSFSGITLILCPELQNWNLLSSSGALLLRSRDYFISARVTRSQPCIYCSQTQ